MKHHQLAQFIALVDTESVTHCINFFNTISDGKTVTGPYDIMPIAIFMLKRRIEENSRRHTDPKNTDSFVKSTDVNFKYFQVIALNKNTNVESPE